MPPLLLLELLLLEPLLLELLLLELPLLELLLVLVPLTVPPPQATTIRLAHRAIARARMEAMHWCRRTIDHIKIVSEISGARAAALCPQGAVVRRDFTVYAQLLRAAKTPAVTEFSVRHNGGRA